MLQSKKGFTLIELLVVVAIIGILAAVGVVAYNGYTASAKERVCLSHFANLKRLINHVDFDINLVTFQRIMTQLIAKEVIPFKGEPLQGSKNSFKVFLWLWA